jgi:hypothetical protein
MGEWERTARLVGLEPAQWERLFKEALVIALRMTHTKDSALKATRRDLAREATQRAFDRLWRLRPTHLHTIDAVRAYVLGALRSELSHEKREHGSRDKLGAGAALEETALGRAQAPSAEVVQLEAARARRASERAGRIVARLREELVDAGDAIALGTIDCLERDHTMPADQAAVLGCTIEEIHSARKRRTRALSKIVRAMDGDDKEKA